MAASGPALERAHIAHGECGTKASNRERRSGEGEWSECLRGGERASACGARGRGGDGGERVGASPPTAAAPSAGAGARGRTVEREAAADAAAAAAVAAVAYLQLFEPLFCRGSSQQPLSAVEAAAVEFSRRTAASGETLHGRSEISKNECEADSESEPQESVRAALHRPGRVCKSLCCARTRISISFPENCANLSASKLSTKLGSPLETRGGVWSSHVE